MSLEFRSPAKATLPILGIAVICNTQLARFAHFNFLHQSGVRPRADFGARIEVTGREIPGVRLFAGSPALQHSYASVLNTGLASERT